MRPDLPAPRAVALACVIVMLPFVVFPGIDTGVSALFRSGEGWLGGGWTEPFRHALWRFSGLVLFAAFLLWLAALWRKRTVWRGSARLWGLIVLIYALGPGVMADGLLKRFWGRARPADTAEFGGSLTFSPPWRPSDQCLSNCSFVSGEVAGATATALALLIVIGLWRDRLSPLSARVATALALSVPLLSALQRLSTGRHFLSDVIFAALFTLLAASLLRLALFGANRPAR